MRVKNRHCTPAEVDSIRNRLRKDRITDNKLAAVLGVSRTQINQMLNGRQPMRRVYRYAIMSAMVEITRNKQAVLP